MRRFFLPISAAAVFGAVLSCPSAVASPAIDGAQPDGKAKPQYSGEIELPSWGENEFRECFDTRIWPPAVLMWLEQENLRALIADPSLPEEERQALKIILAQQNAWRPT